MAEVSGAAPQRRYLTREEYREQGQETTRRELEKLKATSEYKQRRMEMDMREYELACNVWWSTFWSRAVPLALLLCVVCTTAYAIYTTAPAKTAPRPDATISILFPPHDSSPETARLPPLSRLWPGTHRSSSPHSTREPPHGGATSSTGRKAAGAYNTLHSNISNALRSANMTGLRAAQRNFNKAWTSASPAAEHIGSTLTDAATTTDDLVVRPLLHEGRQACPDSVAAIFPGAEHSFAALLHGMQDHPAEELHQMMLSLLIALFSTEGLLTICLASLGYGMLRVLSWRLAHSGPPPTDSESEDTQDVSEEEISLSQTPDAARLRASADLVPGVTAGSIADRSAATTSYAAQGTPTISLAHATLALPATEGTLCLSDISHVAAASAEHSDICPPSLDAIQSPPRGGAADHSSASVASDDVAGRIKHSRRSSDMMPPTQMTGVGAAGSAKERLQGDPRLQPRAVDVCGLVDAGVQMQAALAQAARQTSPRSSCALKAPHESTGSQDRAYETRSQDTQGDFGGHPQIVTTPDVVPVAKVDGAEEVGSCNAETQADVASPAPDRAAIYNEYKAMREHYAELAAALAAKQKDVESVKQRLQTSKRTEEALRAALDDVANLSDRNLTLERELAELKTAEHQAERVNVCITVAEASTVQAASDTAAMMLGVAADAQTPTMAEYRRIETECKALRKMHADVQSQLQELAARWEEERKQASAQYDADLKRELDKKAAELETLHQERRQLQQELLLQRSPPRPGVSQVTGEYAERLAVLQDELEVVVAENAALLSKCERQHEAAAASNAAAHSFEAALQDLRKQHEALAEQHEALAEEYQALDQDNQRQVHAMRQALQGTSSAEDEFLQALGERDELVYSLEQQLDQTRRDLLEVNAEAVARAGEVDQLRAALPPENAAALAQHADEKRRALMRIHRLLSEAVPLWPLVYGTEEHNLFSHECEYEFSNLVKQAAFMLTSAEAADEATASVLDRLTRTLRASTASPAKTTLGTPADMAEARRGVGSVPEMLKGPLQSLQAALVAVRERELAHEAELVRLRDDLEHAHAARLQAEVDARVAQDASHDGYACDASATKPSDTRDSQTALREALARKDAQRKQLQREHVGSQIRSALLQARCEGFEEELQATRSALTDAKAALVKERAMRSSGERRASQPCAERRACLGDSGKLADFSCHSMASSGAHRSAFASFHGFRDVEDAATWRSRFHDLLRLCEPFRPVRVTVSGSSDGSAVVHLTVRSEAGSSAHAPSIQDDLRALLVAADTQIDVLAPYVASDPGQPLALASHAAPQSHGGETRRSPTVAAGPRALTQLDVGACAALEHGGGQLPRVVPSAVPLEGPCAADHDLFSDTAGDDGTISETELAEQNERIASVAHMFEEIDRVGFFRSEQDAPIGQTVGPDLNLRSSTPDVHRLSLSGADISTYVLPTGEVLALLPQRNQREQTEFCNEAALSDAAQAELEAMQEHFAMSCFSAQDAGTISEYLHRGFDSVCERTSTPSVSASCSSAAGPDGHQDLGNCTLAFVHGKKFRDIALLLDQVSNSVESLLGCEDRLMIHFSQLAVLRVQRGIVIKQHEELQAACEAPQQHAEALHARAHELSQELESIMHMLKDPDAMLQPGADMEAARARCAAIKQELFECAEQGRRTMKEGGLEAAQKDRATLESVMHEMKAHLERMEDEIASDLFTQREYVVGLHAAASQAAQFLAAHNEQPSQRVLALFGKLAKIAAGPAAHETAHVQGLAASPSCNTSAPLAEMQRLRSAHRESIKRVHSWQASVHAALGPTSNEEDLGAAELPHEHDVHDCAGAHDDGTAHVALLQATAEQLQPHQQSSWTAQVDLAERDECVAEKPEREGQDHAATPLTRLQQLGGVWPGHSPGSGVHRPEDAARKPSPAELGTTSHAAESQADGRGQGQHGRHATVRMSPTSGLQGILTLPPRNPDSPLTLPGSSGIVTSPKLTSPGTEPMASTTGGSVSVASPLLTHSGRGAGIQAASSAEPVSPLTGAPTPDSARASERPKVPLFRPPQPEVEQPTPRLTVEQDTAPRTCGTEIYRTPAHEFAGADGLTPLPTCVTEFATPASGVPFEASPAFLVSSSPAGGLRKVPHAAGPVSDGFPGSAAMREAVIDKDVNTQQEVVSPSAVGGAAAAAPASKHPLVPRLVHSRLPAMQAQPAPLVAAAELPASKLTLLRGCASQAGTSDPDSSRISDSSGSGESVTEAPLKEPRWPSTGSMSQLPAVRSGPANAVVQGTARHSAVTSRLPKAPCPQGQSPMSQPSAPLRQMEPTPLTNLEASSPLPGGTFAKSETPCPPSPPESLNCMPSPPTALSPLLCSSGGRKSHRRHELTVRQAVAASPNSWHNALDAAAAIDPPSPQTRPSTPPNTCSETVSSSAPMTPSLFGAGGAAQSSYSGLDLSPISFTAGGASEGPGHRPDLADSCDEAESSRRRDNPLYDCRGDDDDGAGVMPNGLAAAQLRSLTDMLVTDTDSGK